MAKISPAQKNYAMAKAYHDALCETVENCKVKVLTENEFYRTAEDGGERITKGGLSYLMSDEDAQKYWDLCFAEYQKKGVAPKDSGTVPTYQAQKALWDAEGELIHSFQQTFRQANPKEYAKRGLDIVFDNFYYHIGMKEKLIDMAMKWTA